MNTETIMNFLADNYKWFMIGAGVLLFALIGFLVSGKKKKEDTNSGVTMNQNDFSQMGTMAQVQDAQAQPQVQPAVAQPVAEAPAEVQPQAQGVQDTIFTAAPVNNEDESEKLVIEAPSGALNNNPNMDTMGMEMPGEPITEVPGPAPVAPESLVIEEPTPVNAVPVEAAPLSPVEPMPVEPTPVVAEPTPVVAEPTPVAAEPTPVAAVPTPVAEAPVMEEPVMSAPVEEMPISMMPEEPAPAPVAPEPVPVAPAPAAAPEVNLQNTIQQ